MIRACIKDRFTGKVAIVTGGSSGIGRAIVEELCKEGASVAFTGISEIGFSVEKDLKGQGYNVIFARGDMMEDAFCRDVVRQSAAQWGRIHYLVNNAFSFTAKGINAAEEDWYRSLFVGPVGYARMVQHALPYLKENKNFAAVVNMSSISAHIAQVSRWTYNAAKGAVHQLTKCQALDLAPYGIRVNSVSPGWIWTREVEKAAMLDGGGREKWDPIWGRYHMLNRCGETGGMCQTGIVFTQRRRIVYHRNRSTHRWRLSCNGTGGPGGDYGKRRFQIRRD